MGVGVRNAAGLGDLPLERVPLRAASMEKGNAELDLGGSMRLKGEREWRFLFKRPIRLCFGERPAGAEEVPEGRAKVLVVLS